MHKIIGIDLGTTNSVVAITEGTKPIIVTYSNGLRTTPSIIAYTKQKKLLVGYSAKRQAVLNPKNTFYSVKKLIGRKLNEINIKFNSFSYDIVVDWENNIKLKCPALNVQFNPEEISAQVLSKLLKDAKVFSNQTINEAVITVPAYFNDSQRQATSNAGKIAGLNVKRILNEPTAASLAYGLDLNKEEIILVFDLGGGTFDVSILEVGDGIFEVISTAGDTNLGGDNFDNIIIDYLINNFKSKEQTDLRQHPNSLQRIKDASERAKVELSSLTETIINLPFINNINKEPKHIKFRLTRIKFEELCESLISSCKISMDNAILDAQITKNQIDQIVLVGGSTRIPKVKKFVQTYTIKKLNENVNPDEVVALGAALQGAVLMGEIKNIVLIDVTPLSLGIEMLGGISSKLIKRNTGIPVKKSDFYSTASDNQTSVEIHVLQGEHELAINNKSLGKFILKNISFAKRGIPKIEVIFDMDVSGMLSVKAIDQNTNVMKSIVIENASRLKQNYINYMIKNTKKFAKPDEAKLKKIIIKDIIVDIIKEAQKFVNRVDKLNLKIKIKILITKIQLNLENLNYPRLNTYINKLRLHLQEYIINKKYIN
jgi:molecular chaperone DnaK